MAQTAANVSAAKPKVGGAVYRAPYGTTLPTSATAELNAAFISLGYCSEDGLVNGSNIETEETKAWGGDPVLSSLTGREDTFNFTLIESKNPDVLGAVYGSANVSGNLTSGITVNVKSAQPESAAWVFDMILRDGTLKRITVPNASITEIADITYSDADAVGYGITILAVPDATENTHYEYLINPATTGGGQ